MTKPRLSQTLILASASPRRARLLTETGIAFRVVVSPAHEPERKPVGIPVDLWPMCLAYMKAMAVRKHLQKAESKSPQPVILAADTIVVDDTPPQRILNKAKDRAHARRMLSSLDRKIHRVITGIALVRGDRVRLASSQAACRIKFPTKAALETYLDSNLWRGKAGAYGIQDDHDPFVTLLSGDFTTVVGLPMPLLQSELMTFLET